MTYAAGTSVDPSKTRSEIDTLLTKNGATHVAIQSAPDSATVAFEIAGKRYRITLPMPTMEQCKPGNKIPPRWYGMQASQREEWVRGQRDQRLRERWRALFLVMKAKLEIARISGFSSVEKEFLADKILPGGTTVYEEVQEAFKTGLDQAEALKSRMLGAGPTVHEGTLE